MSIATVRAIGRQRRAKRPVFHPGDRPPQHHRFVLVRLQSGKLALGNFEADWYGRGGVEPAPDVPVDWRWLVQGEDVFDKVVAWCDVARELGGAK